MLAGHAVYSLWCEVVTLQMRVLRILEVLQAQRRAAAPPQAPAESTRAAEEPAEADDKGWLRAYA